MLLSPQRGRRSLAQTGEVVTSSRSKINSDTLAKAIYFLKGTVTSTHVFQVWFDGIVLPEHCWPFPRSREQITASVPVASKVV